MKKWPVLTLVLLGIVALIFFYVQGIKRQPIRIGFVGELTGIESDLGVDGRDGALLAVEEINARGGIRHRLLEMRVLDDRGDPETARQLDTQLIQEGVVALVGHLTSAQASAVFDQINASRTVLISPTAASTEFSGQPDYFFRLISTNEQMGQALAQHMFTHPELHRIVGVWDRSNRSYTETFWKVVSSEWTRLGGEVVGSFSFASRQSDLQQLMGEVADLQPDAVVFFSGAVDTALMAQYGRQLGLQSSYFTVAWSHTPELLQKGGEAVEGMELVTVYDPESEYPEQVAFIEKFRQRYHRVPSFPAVYSYEAIMVLAHALEKTHGEAAGLREALSNLHNFPAVQGTLSLDANGDVERAVHILKVQNEAFRRLDTLIPNQKVGMDAARALAQAALVSHRREAR